ncbi:MAG: response regulator [Anaerolineales bacterium]|nr:response regulator [Anaerolineales bacterium]
MPTTSMLAEADKLIFAAEETVAIKPEQDLWKVIIVDDEEEIHNVTKLALSDFTFEDKGITFLSAYSGQEAIQLIQCHSDTALILLDVVMETEDAGLMVAKRIRQELGNELVRIVLRTGQPGQAPEGTVVINYDINDYKAKTELTTQKLFTTVVTALRAFGHLTTIENHRRETERLALSSARFVPREFLQVLQKKSIVEIELGNYISSEMTVMFSDIRSFTTLSEMMTPQENFDFVNAYFGYINPIIRENKGFVVKYLGDGMMAIFPERADDAVNAGIGQLKRVAQFNADRQARGYHPIEIGLGVHTGSLMVGIVGDAARMQGDALSDNVNLTSRLEGLTKFYGVSLIISDEVFRRLEDPSSYKLRFLGKVQTKGREAPISVFEVFDGDPAAICEVKQQTKSAFEEGLMLYLQKQFPEASVHFNSVLKHNSEDKVARLYLQRAAHCMVHGVPDDWTGVEVMQEK